MTKIYNRKKGKNSIKFKKPRTSFSTEIVNKFNDLIISSVRDKI